MRLIDKDYEIVRLQKEIEKYRERLNLWESRSENGTAAGDIVEMYKRNIQEIECDIRFLRGCREVELNADALSELLKEVENENNGSVR